MSVRFQTSPKAISSGILTAVENGAYSNQRGPLFHRRPVVLARPHRQFVETPVRSELAQAPEVRARALGVVGLGRHRHQPPHVGISRDQAVELSLWHS